MGLAASTLCSVPWWGVGWARGCSTGDKYCSSVDVGDETVGHMSCGSPEGVLCAHLQEAAILGKWKEHGSERKGRWQESG
jgi:hypothetical protein